MRVLLIEDDDRVADAVRSALTRRGMTVDRVARGRKAFNKITGSDVILLDLGLPDIDGFELCRAIRRASDVAIIVVSARDHVDDRILGLKAGADDYLVKPYDVGELVARVHAVQRRRTETTPARPEVLHVQDVEINVARYEASAGGEPIALSRKEFQLLALIASGGGDVCTRERLIADVWGETWSGANRTLDVHVATLRTKLDRPGLIETVRGVGYRLGQQGVASAPADEN